LKAEEYDGAVGAVVCLIDTEGAKPEGSDKSEVHCRSRPAVLLLKRQKRQLHQSDPAAATRLTYALGHLQLQEKF
jgi:hypothetical protein